MIKALALRIPSIRKIVKQRDALRTERDALRTGRDALRTERDALRTERDALRTERDALRTERDALLTERDALRAEGQAAERDVMNATILQLSDALKHAKVLPIPPRYLQERVVGAYSPNFLASAARSLADFERILRYAGKSLADFDRVLDLGVGCGRVLRRFHELYPRAALTGADIDAEAIAWLHQNYAPAGRFVALPHLPPSQLESEAFELVYAISVFTHLNESMQLKWLAELERVTMSAGYLLLTVHGRKHHNDKHVRLHLSTGFYYNENSGVTEGLPEFYRTAYHTREYVEREWSRFFDIVEYEENGCEGHQDLILCRKKP